MIDTILTRRWAPEIVLALGQARGNGQVSLRFNVLMAAIPGVSDRMLTARLRELEVAGIVARVVVAGPPVRVWYRLTPAGELALHPLQLLAELGGPLSPDEAARL